MSKLNRYNLLISLARHELRYPHVLADTTASDKNEILIRRGVEAWIFLSEDLMCDCSVSEQARDTRIKSLLRLVNSSDFSCIVQTLKKIYDCLINHVSGKEVLTSFSDFKGHITSFDQSLLGYLCSPIKESLNRVIQSQTVVRNDCYTSVCKRDLWRCSHYLLFLTKLNFDSVGLEEKALDDYLAFEAETASLQINAIMPIIPALQSILTGWLKDWSYDGLSSQHGPGSVADSSRAKVSKYSSLASDDRVRYLFNNDKSLLDGIIPFGATERVLHRSSKLVFVPKDVTKLRSISMEPTTLQYLQQGCMNSLMRYFRSNSQLRHILKLEDQSQNQALAYQGSITDEYATIDLSHASDSVNWELVKKLFSRVPKLLRWLVCTRSTHTTLPSGDEISLTKFAPMGSSLCFPVESLVFAAIAKLSILLSREESLDRDDSTGIRSRNIFLSVYGDDIILPKYAAQKCITLLTLCGFQPNVNKSYLDGPFKESCGGNFYCGYDITAIKFTPKFDLEYKLGVSPQAYSALCSYANLAYKRGLPLFRLYCIKLIFESGNKPLFTDRLDQSPAIFSLQPTNFHLRKRWNKDYQKYLINYTGIKTVYGEVSEDALYKKGHIFLYDSLLLNQFRTSTVLEYNLNASLKKGSLLFDSSEAYNPSTLYTNTVKFASCECDV